MRKMKRLFKVRNRIIPWYHWSIINMYFDFVSFIAMFVTSIFTDDAKLIFTWLAICILQLIPSAIIQLITWLLTRTMSKKIVSIILEKVKDSKLQSEKISIQVSKHNLHTCTVNITSIAYNSSELDHVFMPMIHDINRKFGNNYYVHYIRNKFENPFI